MTPPTRIDYTYYVLHHQDIPALDLVIEDRSEFLEESANDREYSEARQGISQKFNRARGPFRVQLINFPVQDLLKSRWNPGAKESVRPIWEREGEVKHWDGSTVRVSRIW